MRIDQETLDGIIWGCYVFLIKWKERMGHDQYGWYWQTKRGRRDVSHPEEVWFFNQYGIK